MDDYDTIIVNQTSKKPTGCSYCSGYRVRNENNFLFLFPEIASEWHPKKNGDSRPEEFANSNGKKVWWLCPKSHDYDSIIYNRTEESPFGCPQFRRNSS